MSKLKVGDVVVHKTLGNQPLVVVDIESAEVTRGEKTKTEVVTVVARYAVSGQYGLQEFRDADFNPNELETPLESIAREAEIFQALNEKRDEINNKPKPGPVGISHLN